MVNTQEGQASQGEQGMPTILVHGDAGQRSLRTYNLEEAADFLCRRISSSWQVTIPTETDVRVTEEFPDLEGMGELRILSPINLVPAYQGYRRYDDDTYGWTLHLGSNNSRMFDRDLTWVNLATDDPSTFTFGVAQEHGLPADELARGMSEVAPKVNEFIGAVLFDNPNPPYIELL
jgi:hypothetical protein